MPTKPSNSNNINWNGVSELEEPSAGQKNDGFANAQRPPAGYFNWFWNRVSGWVDWMVELFRPSAADQDEPTVEYYDADGRVRMFVDPMGGRGGNFIERSYVWASGNYTVGNSTADAVIVPGAGTAGEIEGETGSNSTINFKEAGDNNSGFPTTVCELICGTGANDVAEIHQNLSVAALNGWEFTDDISWAMEWTASQRETGTPDHDMYMGVCDLLPAASADAGDATALNFLHFRLEDGGTNWICAAADGVAETTVDSGVAPTDDVMQEFRIEYHGANTPRGVLNSDTATVVFFIDGARVAGMEIADANVPVNTAMGILMRIDRPGGAGTGTKLIEIGKLRWILHYHLAGYTLASP